MGLSYLAGSVICNPSAAAGRGAMHSVVIVEWQSDMVVLRVEGYLKSIDLDCVRN